MSTLILQDELFLEHQTGQGHPERPDRLRCLKNILEQGLNAKKYVSGEKVFAREEDILRVHDKDLFKKVSRTENAGGVYLDADTFASDQSFAAAMAAAGSLIECGLKVMQGEVDNAFAFVRPPGHHAERNHSMGFCLFNNIAILAEYLIQKEGVKKVAIVDFDVHHGNGTQDSFYERADVFYASSHQYPFYPGTGAASERGRGAGLGTTLNVPLQAGSGDEVFIAAYQNQIIPSLKAFKPEVLLVSAGYDAHHLDPLGSLQVSKAGFAQVSNLLHKLANELCSGREIYVLEGGYSLDGLQEGVLASLNALNGDQDE